MATVAAKVGVNGELPVRARLKFDHNEQDDVDRAPSTAHSLAGKTDQHRK